MRARKVSAGWTYEGEGYVVEAGAAPEDDGWIVEVLSVAEEESGAARPDLLDAASTDAGLLSMLADRALEDAVEEMYERAERMAVDY